MKTLSPEVTTTLLNDHAEDLPEGSHLTLIRLYQKGETANGPGEAFAVDSGRISSWTMTSRVSAGQWCL